MLYEIISHVCMCAVCVMCVHSGRKAAECAVRATISRFTFIPRTHHDGGVFCRSVSVTPSPIPISAFCVSCPPCVWFCFGFGFSAPGNLFDVRRSLSSRVLSPYRFSARSPRIRRHIASAADFSLIGFFL